MKYTLFLVVMVSVASSIMFKFISLCRVDFPILLPLFACTTQQHGKEHKEGYGNAVSWKARKTIELFSVPSHKALKIDEADFHISTATTTS